jgi:hypothetical protein
MTHDDQSENTNTKTSSDDSLNLAAKGGLRFKQRCDDIWDEHECSDTVVAWYRIGRMAQRLLKHPEEYGFETLADVAASTGQDPEWLSDVLRLTAFTAEEISRYCDDVDPDDTESISIIAKITDDATRALFLDRVADGEFSYREELEQAINFHAHRDCV